MPKGANSAVLRFSILGGKIEDGKENPKIFYKNISFQEEITPNSTPLIDEGSA
jgi:hypothetical protein